MDSVVRGAGWSIGCSVGDEFVNRSGCILRWQWLSWLLVRGGRRMENLVAELGLKRDLPSKLSCLCI